MLFRKQFLGALAALSLIAFETSAQTTGSFNETITFMGASRTLSCYVPPGYDPSVPCALIVGLHGAGDNSTAYRDALVGPLGFPAAVTNTILVCPDGGSDPGKDFYTPAGDEAIIEEAIQFAQTHYAIDANKIVLQGFSLGGRSALRYGLNHPGEFLGLLLNTPAVQGVKEADAQWGAAGLYNYPNAGATPMLLSLGNDDALYQGPVDHTYEQLIRNDAAVSMKRFAGGHTVPPFSFMGDIFGYFSQPAQPGADAELVHVVTDLRKCDGGAITPHLLVHNAGNTPLSAIHLKYDWGGAVQSFTWNGTMPSFGHADIDLPSFTPANGDYTLHVTIDTLNGNVADTFVTNNTDSADFRIVATAKTLPYREDFNTESFGDDWYTEASGDYFSQWGYDGDVKAMNTFNTLWVFENTGIKEELISPVVNFSSLPDPFLTFDVSFNYSAFTAAFLGIDTSFSDTLEVLVSTDCGATYQSVYKKTGAALATFPQPITNPASIQAYLFTPGANDWRKERIDLTPYATSTDASVKFRYISGLGGCIYIDNVAVENKTTGINEMTQPVISLSPNPAQDIVTINAGNDKLRSVLVSDLSGRTVLQQQENGRNTTTVSTAALPNGIYLFNISSDKGSMKQKLVVRH
ncbi:T9SS type A sorting domain-containing protein [Taibaiella koreensis]|uniref:T9SS type A sorting domain-containing protein n=1 Tax=Taibaiella koreensis TaxID=1268548 RepID=UPI000E59FC62|nr:T9SS type A sorting domain-containing protein [Taibaiella koreensis]